MEARVDEMTVDDPVNKSMPVTETGAIKVDNLRFAYPGKGSMAVLEIPDWHIDRGDRVFIKGPSGSGKSTLLNLFAGILLPSAGTVNVLGQDLAALSAHQRDAFRARHVGMVFQQFNLIHYLSVLDNIRLAAYFAAQNRSEVERKARQLFAALELSIDLMHRPASELSIGQQQRVAIVRALINAPEILIADEPTSALDSYTRDAFMRLLLNISDAQHTTLIVVSHDTALTPYFDRVVDLIAMNRGRKGKAKHVR